MARRDFGSQLASFGKSRAVINEATCEMKEADVPLMSQWTCETQPEECNHCLAFLIHLGCDIRHEIEDIQDNIIELVDQLADQRLIPGRIKLALTYFGDENNIQIPLTFSDPINDRRDLHAEIKQAIVPDITPRQRANLTIAMEETLQLFNDHEGDYESAGFCESKTVYFISNGHVQCGPCVCNSIVCPNFNETDFECWENTNKITLAEIGNLKEEHSDVNMIFATPNDDDCMTKSQEGHDQAGRDRSSKTPEWWAHFDAKNTEDCYNATNVQMLANWRSDQLRNDPNLSCDDFNLQSPYYSDPAKYPYDVETARSLCNRMTSSSPPLPAVNLPANLRGVKRLSDAKLNANILSYVMGISQSCTAAHQKESQCHGEISWAYPANEATTSGKGCDGPRGPNGRPGRVGGPGAGGPKGPQGPDGAQGSPGYRGDSGPDGEPSRIVTRGDKGPKGQSGAPGAPGRPGAFGVPGPSGSAGNPGVKGVEGPPGLPGCYGPSGARGVQGRTGGPGPHGPQGRPGPAGVGMDEAYLAEYKKVLRQVINDEINSGGSSEMLRLISDMLRSQYGLICAASDTCQTQKTVSWLRDTVQPQCEAPVAVPFRMRQRADEPEYRRQEMAPLDTCQCHHGPTNDWRPTPPPMSPYEPIEIRRPDPQVIVDLPIIAPSDDDELTTENNDSYERSSDDRSDSSSDDWGNSWSFTKRNSPKITKRRKQE